MSVYIKNYEAPEINEKEIRRYLGAGEDIPEIKRLIDECLSEAEDKLSYKTCYTVFPIKICGDEVDLCFTRVKSKSLAKNLKGCNRIILFAATVGIELDRLISKYGVLSPTKALIFQAIGAERIEGLCDSFNKEIKTKYKYSAPRFSAGYGDFPIEAQREIFSALDSSKHIGVSLSESLMMSPSKSVTALIGILDEE